MNSKRLTKSIFVLILFLYSNLNFANQPLVRNFTRTNYKSGTQNWAIAQNESNSMYFANNNGLLEFDGKNWATYPIVNGTNVRSVLYSKDGRFYASTFNEFGYFKKQKNGQFLYYTLMNKLTSKQVGSNELYNIIEGNKHVYFQSEKSLYQYNGNTVTQIPFNYRIDAAASIYNVLFVASAQSGVFMLNGNFFSRIPGSELLINKKVCSILPFKGDKILFVTSFNGVYLYDGASIIPFNTGIDDFLKNNQVFCATTNGKQLVFGTVQRGIAVQYIADGKVTFVNTYSGLQNNTVLSAAFDNQQNLWLGLDNGIDYVMLNSPIQNMFGTNNLYGAGYTSFLKDNTLYFGTNQGLYSTSYPLPNNSVPLQLKLVKGMEGQVWGITEIDNTLFCGDDQGAFIVYPDHAERIQGLPGTWNFRELKKHPGMILGCSYQGLFILKKNGASWQLSHFIKGKFNESSPMFEEDNDGTVWFSHWQKGLFHLNFNAAMDRIQHIDVYNSRNGFPSDRNNTLFRVGNEIIFSSERGFYQFDEKNKRMQPYGKWNKIFNHLPSYMRLHEGENGDVWCVSGRFVGLAKKKPNNTYAMDSLTYRILQPKIIIGFEHFNFIDNNNVILSTEDGFSWLDTKTQSFAKNTFKVFVRNVIVTNDKSKTSTEKMGFGNSKPKEAFSHKHNSLRFEFIAPEYRNDGLVQYSYMLENYDENWSEFSNDNIKEYTQLPKGNYVFKVRARDILEAKEAICTYSFTILPAWYETQIAFIIYGILIILAVFGLGLFVNDRSKKGAVDMEKRKELEIKEQRQKFDAETSEKKREIKELKNQQLQYELRHKSQELASSTMNLIRKNEILLEVMDHITKVTSDIKTSSDTNAVLSRLSKMERNIKQNIENDNNWKRFEENFDLVYENYLKRLGEMFPELNVSDKKLCAYLKMDLSSKDIAPLLNMSVRSVETNRYRLRKKMDLDRDVNLSEFLQRL